MPQQIDPNTGQPMGIGDPYVGAPETIPGLDGLMDARRVDDNYQLGAFEYYRNQGGQRYVQNALTNPNEGAPPAATGSYQSATGQAYPQQQQPQQPQQGGIGGGIPPQFLQMMRMLSGGIGWDGGDPYGSPGYGQANDVPNAYGGWQGGGGYPPAPGGQRPQRNIGAFAPQQNRMARPTGIGQPSAYSSTLSGGINRGGFSFRRGGRV